MKLVAVLIMLSSVQVWASSPVVGTWKIIQQKCEINGGLVSGFSDASDFNAVVEMKNDGTFFQSLTVEGKAIEVTGRYSVAGNSISRTAQTIKDKTGTRTIDDGSIGSYSVDQVSLVVTSNTITKNDECCPVGDKAITIMKRVK